MALAACGLGAALLLGRGVALADTVTGTTGDISYSVTWLEGPNPNETTLVVTNTAAPGGRTISDFLFDTGTSADIIGVSGGGCRTEDFSNQPLPAGQIECGNALAPGQSETIIISTASDGEIAAGAHGTITFSDDAEVGQPAVTVTLQASGGGGSTSTSTSSSTGTSTSAGTATCPGYPAYPEPPGCADVRVTGVDQGLFFENSDSVYGVVLAEGKQAGFQRFTNWQDGEQVYIRVTVANFGPDHTTVRPSLKGAARGDQISYGGLEGKGNSSSQQTLSPTLPLPDPTDIGEAVDFRVTVHGVGKHTFTARATGAIPDPAPANNSMPITIEVQPRPNFTARWDPKAQRIEGVQMVPARGPAAVGASGAKLGPVEVAVLQTATATPVWQRATGTAQWSLHLGKVKPASVIVLVRNVAPANQATIEFSPALHNYFKLRLG